jgi:hypothetical protein
MEEGVAADFLQKSITRDEIVLAGLRQKLRQKWLQT